MCLFAMRGIVGSLPRDGSAAAGSSPAATAISDELARESENDHHTFQYTAGVIAMAFVGREAELDTLAREIALAVELSVGRSVFLFGPPGAGKTALVTELLERTARERPELAIARGRCLQSFGSGDPYLPFVNALEDLADESTQGSVQKETLSSLLTELAPYWLSVVPLVGGLLSATFATAAKLRGQASQGAAPSREALFVQYLEVIKRLAQRSPLLLLLDDLHWADQSSLALLAHLARSIERLPVVILGTFRTGEEESDRHPVQDLVRELERENIGKRLVLGELGATAVASLMAGEFGGDVSEPLRRWMLQTAGANPLFVTELARLLKQSEAVVERHGEWFLADAIQNFEIPRSAEAVIETRIQRLDPEEVRVLQYASIEGNEFNSTVLAGLLDTDELELLDALEKLERRHQLIQTTGELELPDGDVASVYQFRHALVQTVLYRQVVGKRRILLHRKAGELLESVHQDSLEDVAGKLARHFHQGRLGEAAHRYSCTAADRARRVYAHWEAEEFFKIALETSSTDEVKIELEERLGDVYDAVALYEPGIACYGRAQSFGPTDPTVSIRLRRKVVTLERKGGLVPAPVLLQQVRTLLAEAVEYPREHCELMFELTMLPDASGVLEAAETAVQISETLDEPLLLADAIQRLAIVHILRGGQVDQALPLLERAQGLVTAVGDPLRSAHYYNLAGIAHAKLGRYEDSRREFEGMLEVSDRLGDPKKVAAACINLGALMLRLGAYEEADQLLQRARTINERRDRAGLLQSLFNLAERARLVGDLPAAVSFYTQLLERAREFEYSNSEAVAHAGMGLCHLEAGRTAEARECAWRAVAVVADREEWFEDRDIIELLLARLERLDGQYEAAVGRLSRAAQTLEAADVYLWAMVELERTRLMQDQDPSNAHVILLSVIQGTSRLQSPLLQRHIAVLSEALSSELSAASEELA